MVTSATTTATTATIATTTTTWAASTLCSASASECHKVISGSSVVVVHNCRRSSVGIDSRTSERQYMSKMEYQNLSR